MHVLFRLIWTSCTGKTIIIFLTWLNWVYYWLLWTFRDVGRHLPHYSREWSSLWSHSQYQFVDIINHGKGIIWERMRREKKMEQNDDEIVQLLVMKKVRRRISESIELPEQEWVSLDDDHGRRSLVWWRRRQIWWRRRQLRIMKREEKVAWLELTNHACLCVYSHDDTPFADDTFPEMPASSVHLLLFSRKE